VQTSRVVRALGRGWPRASLDGEAEPHHLGALAEGLRDEGYDPAQPVVLAFIPPSDDSHPAGELRRLVVLRACSHRASHRSAHARADGARRVWLRGRAAAEADRTVWALTLPLGLPLELLHALAVLLQMGRSDTQVTGGPPTVGEGLRALIPLRSCLAQPGGRWPAGSCVTVPQLQQALCLATNTMLLVARVARKLRAEGHLAHLASWWDDCMGRGSLVPSVAVVERILGYAADEEQAAAFAYLVPLAGQVSDSQFFGWAAEREAAWAAARAERESGLRRSLRQAGRAGAASMAGLATPLRRKRKAAAAGEGAKKARLKSAKAEPFGHGGGEARAEWGEAASPPPPAASDEEEEAVADSAVADPLSVFQYNVTSLPAAADSASNVLFRLASLPPGDESLRGPAAASLARRLRSLLQRLVSFERDGEALLDARDEAAEAAADGAEAEEAELEEEAVASEEAGAVASAGEVPPVLPPGFEAEEGAAAASGAVEEAAAGGAECGGEEEGAVDPALLRWGDVHRQPLPLLVMHRDAEGGELRAAFLREIDLSASPPSCRAWLRVVPGSRAVLLETTAECLAPYPAAAGLVGDES